MIINTLFKHYKKNILLVILFAFLVNIGFAQIPNGYYNTATGTGATLKTALKTIITNNHSVTSYNSLWTAYQTTDKKTDGKVWDMYTDIPGGTPAFTFTYFTKQWRTSTDYKTDVTIPEISKTIQ